jgi:parallel beta-helix repeat protein
LNRKVIFLSFLIVFLLVSALPLAQSQTSNFTVAQIASTYTTKNAAGAELYSGSNPNTAISTAVNAATAGNRITVTGSFPVTGAISLNKGLYFDLTQATVSIATGNLFYVTGGNGYTFHGGSVSSGTYPFYMVNCQNVLIEDASITGSVIIGYGSSGMKVENNNINGNGNDAIGLYNSGYNEITGNTIHNTFNGIFAGACPHNLITYNDYSAWHVSGGHANYFDGASGSGFNEFAYNTFHDASNGAAFHLKCKNNNIHHNTFIGLPIGAPPFSIYSEHPGYEANNNDIHHNTFTNCYWGFNLGTSTTGGEVCVGNKIHDNYLSGVQRVFTIAFGSSLYQNVEDTWFYYNTLSGCGQVFYASATNSKVVDTVVAYNDFSGSTPSASVLQGYANSMVYGNIGLADYNVPSPLPITESGEPLPTPTPTPSTTPTPTSTPVTTATPTPTSTTPTPTPSVSPIINEDEVYNFVEKNSILMVLLGVVGLGLLFIRRGKKKN